MVGAKSMVVGAYIRANTSKQEKGHEAQLLALKEYLISRNIQSFKVYAGYGGQWSMKVKEWSK